MTKSLAGSASRAAALLAGALTSCAAQCAPAGAQRLVHGTRVLTVCGAPDDSFVLGGDAEGRLVRWQRAAGREPSVVRAHGHPLLALDLSPDGALIATSCRGGLLRVWNAKTSALVFESAAHGAVIEDLRFATARTLVTVGHDSTVRWWDARTGSETLRARHSAQVYSVALSADGAQVFTGGDDPGLRVWNAATAAPITFVPAVGNQFFALAASAQGLLVAGGPRLSVFAQHDIARTLRQFRDRAHHGWIACVAFSPDGSTIASGGDDGVLRVWDVESGAEIRTLPGHPGGVASVAFLDRGSTIAVADDRGVALHRL
jgi:WD40 repeat protein